MKYRLLYIRILCPYLCVFQLLLYNYIKWSFDLPDCDHMNIYTRQCLFCRTEIDQFYCRLKLRFYLVCFFFLWSIREMKRTSLLWKSNNSHFCSGHFFTRPHHNYLVFICSGRFIYNSWLWLIFTLFFFGRWNCWYKKSMWKGKTQSSGLTDSTKCINSNTKCNRRHTLFKSTKTVNGCLNQMMGQTKPNQRIEWMNGQMNEWMNFTKKIICFFLHKFHFFKIKIDLNNFLSAAPEFWLCELLYFLLLFSSLCVCVIIQAPRNIFHSFFIPLDQHEENHLNGFFTLFFFYETKSKSALMRLWHSNMLIFEFEFLHQTKRNMCSIWARACVVPTWSLQKSNGKMLSCSTLSFIHLQRQRQKTFIKKYKMFV